MACTKNGRIRKLIKHNEEHCKTFEVGQPNQSRMVESTVWSKDEKGAKVKTKTMIIIVDHTYGRTERREREIERLKQALKGESKKGRMRKFSHKQTKRAEEKGPRKKKGKG